MYADFVYNAYMSSIQKSTTQLTIRGVPTAVKKRLEERARAERKSLNAVLVQALTVGAGMGAEEVRYHDLDEFMGTWVEDPAFDEAIAAQHVIDEEMWR